MLLTKGWDSLMNTLTYEYGENLYINVTNECPNHCDFCLRNHSKGSIYADNLWYEGQEPSKEELWEDIVKRDLDQYTSVVFCGYGEPTCRLDDVLWLAKKIKEQGDYITRMNTNGLSDLINGRDTANEMAGLIDMISVSLNASTPEEYEHMCKSDFGACAYDSMIHFTKAAVSSGIRTYMTVISTMPDDEIENCRIICESIGAIFRIRQYIDK